MNVVWLLSGLFLFLAPLHAGAGTCPSMPQDLVLTPGQEVRLANTAFDLMVDVQRPASRLRGASGNAPAAVLALDLLARVRDPGGRVREGSYLPHLDVSYAVSGAAGILSTGQMTFRMSSRGPSYGTTIDLDPAAEQQLSVTATVLRRADAAGSDPVIGNCPALPLRLTWSVEVDAPPHEDVTAATQATGGSETVTLVGSLDPLPAISSPYSDVWGYTNGATILAILGSSEGTHFIDVTDPTNPVQISFIDGPNSPWRDIKTYQHYAYMVTEGIGVGQGLQIVDLSNPLNPTLVNTYTTNFATAHNVYIDTDIGQAWLIGTNNGARILDLSQDPENPVEIGNFAAPYVHDAFVRGNLAYLSEIFAGTHEILDSTDPANLQSLSVIFTPTQFTHNSWTNDDATILATTDETNPGGHVGIYDISDKTNPVLLGEYQASTSTLVHNVMFDDDDDTRVAMSHYALGFKLIDVRQPTMPIEIGSYDTYPANDTGFNGVWGIYAFEPRGYFYVSDRQTGLYILQYTPDGGTLTGQVTDAETGLPVEGAEVLVLPANAELETGADGMFGPFIVEGQVVLRLEQVGYRTRIVDAGVLEAGENLDIDIEIEPLPRVGLSGFVLREGDLTGIEGVTVSLVGTPSITVSGADGSYQFPDAATGQQLVTAETFGYASGEARVVLAPGGPGTLDLILEPARFADNMESAGAWTAGEIGALESGGWERVDPNGTDGGTVQPEDDHTPTPGVSAFITGQSSPGAGRDENDVEGGTAMLDSPSIDLSGMDVARLRYHRWFSNGSGVFESGQLRIEASSNGTGFLEIETQEDDAASWIRREADLGSLVALTSAFKMRLLATAGPFDAEFQTLECGLDDVDIVSACHARFSPELADSDADRRVDACDACPLDSANDADADGFCGDADNSPFTASGDQADTDLDRVGNVADNCPNVPNSDQRDLDGDDRGDACDPDVDGDGLDNGVDPDQDDDGILNGADLCPTTADTVQLDDDSDGEGNACDADDSLVQGVRLHAGGLISWELETNLAEYNVYRGDLGSDLLLPLAACRAIALQTPYHVEEDLPIPGSGFFYLVSTLDRSEGSLGRLSSGVERLVAAPCP